MKKSDRLVVVIEGLLFVMLAFLVQCCFPDMIGSRHLSLKVGFFLIIFYAFRRGPRWGTLAGLLLGIVTAFTVSQPAQHAGQIAGMIIGSACLGIAGLFARNLQRTLYNQRMFSVYLNLVTGTFLALAAFFVVRTITMQWFMPDIAISFKENLAENGLSFLTNLVIILVILIVMLNTMGKHFIPRNTPYISRRERSRLLND